MAEIEIKEINYQRNGISGEGFFQVLFDWTETETYKGKTYTTRGGNFIATFTIKDDDKDKTDHVDTVSCRVINPFNFQSDWRGDNFGSDIDKEFLKLKKTFGVDRIYDVMDKLMLQRYGEIICLYGKDGMRSK